MRHLDRVVPIAVGLALLPAVALAAFGPRDIEDRSVRLPMEDVLEPVAPWNAQDLSKAATHWKSFETRNGQWEVVWNGWTGTAHRAFGEGIQVSGPVLSKDQATRVAEQFLRSESPLTKAGDLDIRSAATLKGGRVWYANFLQYHEGIPVLHTDITVRLDESGKVMMFGSDARTDIDLDARPLYTEQMARDSARQGLQFDYNRDTVSGGDEIYVLPIDHPTGTDYHLVRRVRVSQANPPHEWDTFVDAHNGEIRWRFDRVRYGTVSGNVEANVKEHGPLDPVQIPLPARHQFVEVGGVSTFTDENGDYSVNAPSGIQNVTMRLEGPYVNVNRTNGSDAQYSTSVNTDTNPTLDYLWQGGGNNSFTERMGFYHTNLVHDWIKDIDPGFTNIDYSMACNVNIADPDGCNAFWNGSSINFYAASAQCNNIGNVADVIYHEYGHGINDKLYQQAGSPTGLNNGALHEGLADVVATLLEDDPELGQGFFKTSPNGIRNVDNTNTYPFDVSGSVHNDGLIIGGAFWDLRQQVGVATASSLHHFARYGLPQDSNLKIAFQEYFIETLVADDDNGDLSDQTPNWAAILDSFNQHGIGPSLFLTMTHTELADVGTAGNPIAIDVNVSSSSGLFGLDTNAVKVIYSVDGGADQEVLMAAGGGNLYTGTLPGQASGTLVSYYTQAAAEGGAPVFRPNDPTSVRYSFLVGEQVQVAFDDFESDTGWTVNDGTDDAISGIWTRVDPDGVVSGSEQLQPGSDHSDPGTLCWVTGNADGGQPGADDVDNGKTTLLSPIFDASGLHRPAVRYYRWYTNNLGAEPGLDVWQVDISNDGGSSWTPVENTTGSANEWSKIIVQIENFVTPTNNMQMRFIAADTGGGSLVEAGVDDWELIEFNAAVAVEDQPDRPRTYALGQNQPNPFNPATEISFSLPRSGRASLQVYDLAGRRVRTLVDGEMPAGVFTARWNGRDQAGAPVSSGIYLYRLVAGDFVQTKRMVLVK